MRVPGTNKDKGHYARKAVWLTIAVLLLVPHIIATAATHLDEWIMTTGSKLHRWSHPCLYAPKPPRR